MITINNNILGKYINGNYTVTIYNDGTKIRETNDTNFIPNYAENCDVKITDYCDGGCEFCYEGCTPTGQHANLLNQNWINTLHPFTELALNGNDLTHPQLIQFLELLKEKQIIANLTVNQKHFIKNADLLHKLTNEKLIYGLGISLTTVSNDFIFKVQEFPNAVLHTIAGILKPADMLKLANNRLKLLILGYKTKGRGEIYYEQHKNAIQENIEALKAILPLMKNHFEVISFDNLAIEQLDVKNTLNILDDEWSEIYMGDDGKFTFYIDMVNQTFAKNSVMTETYPILDSVDDMFKYITKTEETCYCNSCGKPISQLDYENWKGLCKMCYFNAYVNHKLEEV